jgi:Icc-related predicted phosphoesterase
MNKRLLKIRIGHDINWNNREKKMKLVCFSDTHNKHDQITLPEGDVLIHAGDYSLLPKNADLATQLKELKAFNDWLGSIKDKFTYILYTSGNHDIIFEKEPKLAESYLKNAITLNDKEIILFNKYKIYGTPSQPPFCNWSFNHDSELRTHKYKNIPDDTDILITHCPPWGILDQLDDGSHVGCAILRNRIRELKNLKAHIVGHIHEGYGQMEENGVQYINACICTKQYRPDNEVQIVEV